jgi:hypothetical protein
MKILIYSWSVDPEEDLTACVVETAATIRQKPGICERTCQSLLRCVGFVLMLLAAVLHSVFPRTSIMLGGCEIFGFRLSLNTSDELCETGK